MGSPPVSFVHGILQAGIPEWVPFPSPGDLPDPGIKPGSPALQADSLSLEPPRKPIHACSVSQSLALGSVCGAPSQNAPVLSSVPGGAAEHHLQPGLRERGDRHPATVAVPAPCHRGAGGGCQVACAAGHHRVYASAGGTAGESTGVGQALCLGGWVVQSGLGAMPGPGAREGPVEGVRAVVGVKGREGKRAPQGKWTSAWLFAGVGSGFPGLCPDLRSLNPDLLSRFLQGVEFFDEKLNSLCMAWLVDHGEHLPRISGRRLGLQKGAGVDWGRWGVGVTPLLPGTWTSSLAFWIPTGGQGGRWMYQVTWGCQVQWRV